MTEYQEKKKLWSKKEKKNTCARAASEDRLGYERCKSFITGYIIPYIHLQVFS